MEKNFKDYPLSEAWRYLGSDEKTDFYVVNEANEDDSLTGVFGQNAGEYWSYPIYMNSILSLVQSRADDTDAGKCYKLYAEQGGKFTHDGTEAEEVERAEWQAREDAKMQRKITIPLYLYEDIKGVISEYVKTQQSDAIGADELNGILDDIQMFEDMYPERLVEEPATLKEDL